MKETLNDMETLLCCNRARGLLFCRPEGRPRRTRIWIKSAFTYEKGVIG